MELLITGVERTSGQPSSFSSFFYVNALPLVFISVEEKQLNVEGLILNVDNEGSTLLHLAVDSGILPVR